MRRPWWLAVSAALLTAMLLLHRSAAHLCDELLWRWGFARYDRAMLAGMVALSLAVAAVLALRRANRPARPRAFAAVLVGLLLASLAAHRFLLVANVELVHLPQYALMVVTLRLAGLPLTGAWLAATGAGVADEVYQHLVVYAGRPDTYLDFNDMVLNAIGAAWAAVLLSGGPEDGARLRRAAAGVAGAAGAALLVWQPPRWADYFHHAATGRSYHVMVPGEAVAACLGLGALVAAGIRAGAAER